MTRCFRVWILLASGLSLASSARSDAIQSWRVIGWNNLGMHCMDADYSVFSILPPFNEIHIQLIDSQGHLVTKTPVAGTVTYQSVFDTAGSINTTSYLKTNFWDYTLPLLGATLAPDAGVAGFTMPGSSNSPRKLAYEPTNNWYLAAGIPIVPTDDAGLKNYFPMMRIEYTDATQILRAQTSIVLPVSDEMDCRACHASGTQPSSAMPSTGWVYNPNAEQDYRQNILKLHDAKNGKLTQYPQYLAAAKYRSEGLYATAVAGVPILCDRCHLSNAVAPLGIAGMAGIPPLTAAIHSFHSKVLDPVTGLTLDNESDRRACYNCHPGSQTRCLRGAMGNAVAADGTMEIQCQNCHGNMSAMGAGTRQGWLEEPNCQSCHTGTATQNSGQIRYTSVFDTSGGTRKAASAVFATNPDTPATGISLYRFSKGHGGLQCEACHGSTHAEYPSSQANDNVQNQNLQGHIGKLVECNTCHAAPQTASGGPHGLHPVGQAWVNAHPDVAESQGTAQCQACHGADYRGSVLAYSQADRTLSTEYGTKSFWRGFQVSCYACHNGPGSDDRTLNRPPAVINGMAVTTIGQSVSVTLNGSDPDRNPLTFRIVSQPSNGTVALSGRAATFFPAPGFQGSDRFTFAAWDGFTNSNLGTIGLSVQ